MTRAQLEHLLRAAGAITGKRVFVVVGSQALLGVARNAPADLLVSMEADMYPEDAPEMADLVDGTIGELSPFHETFGYYAHGVGPATAALPSGWRERVAVIESSATEGVRGLCISPVDLAVSKLAAGREKDIVFVGGMIRHGLVTRADIGVVLDELPDGQAIVVRRALDERLG